MIDLKQRAKSAPADEEFRAWVRSKIEGMLHLTEGIVASGEEHVPLLLIFERGSGRVAMNPLSLASSAEKRSAFALHRMMALHPACEGAIMITESWDLVLRPEEVEPTGSIEHDPRRREVMVFNALRGTETGTMQIMTIYRILRDDGGARMDRSPRVFDPHVEMAHGRFVVSGQEEERN